jgi:hypothetical protein
VACHAAAVVPDSRSTSFWGNEYRDVAKYALLTEKKEEEKIERRGYIYNRRLNKR